MRPVKLNVTICYTLQFPTIIDNLLLVDQAVENMPRFQQGKLVCSNTCLTIGQIINYMYVKTVSFIGTNRFLMLSIKYNLVYHCWIIKE